MVKEDYRSMANRIKLVPVCRSRRSTNKRHKLAELKLII